jgi:methylmalonyl-CoA/ethylmalonyl-CoA epimerase
MRKIGISISTTTTKTKQDVEMKLGVFNHVAIVVPDLAAATILYRDILGGTVTAPKDLPDHGVTTVFVELPNTKLELLHPFGEKSPIAKFLESNPAGGIHHVCIEVEDVVVARDTLRAKGIRITGDGEPRIGAHGKPVIFLHPKDMLGTLVELEQA